MIYFIEPNLSQILSFQYVINVKLLMRYFPFFTWTISLKSSVDFTLTAHLRLDEHIASVRWPIWWWLHIGQHSSRPPSERGTTGTPISLRKIQGTERLRDFPTVTQLTIVQAGICTQAARYQSWSLYLSYLCHGDKRTLIYSALSRDHWLENTALG